MKYAGAEWLKRQLDYDPSPLGCEVADFLGDVWLGLYHMEQSAILKTWWNDPLCIKITVYGDLATVDFNKLTTLVVLAHDRMLRVNLCGCGPRYMKMLIHKRDVRDGCISERCPTIEDHISSIRKCYQACDTLPGSY